MRSSPTDPSAKGAPDGKGTDEELGVDASAYKGAINTALATCWYSSKEEKLGLMSVGEVVIEFAIDAKGAATGIRVVSDNTGNEANARFAIRSICDARFPPIPPEILARLPGRQKLLKRMFTFVVNP